MGETVQSRCGVGRGRQERIRSRRRRKRCGGKRLGAAWRIGGGAENLRYRRRRAEVERRRRTRSGSLPPAPDRDAPPLPRLTIQNTYTRNRAEQSINTPSNTKATLTSRRGRVIRMRPDAFMLLPSVLRYNDVTTRDSYSSGPSLFTGLHHSLPTHPRSLPHPLVQAAAPQTPSLTVQQSPRILLPFRNGQRTCCLSQCRIDRPSIPDAIQPSAYPSHRPRTG